MFGIAIQALVVFLAAGLVWLGFEMVWRHFALWRGRRQAQRQTSTPD